MGENLSSRTPVKPAAPCRPCPVRLADPSAADPLPAEVSTARSTIATAAKCETGEHQLEDASDVPKTIESVSTVVSSDGCVEGLSPMSEQSGDITHSSDEASDSSFQLSSSSTAPTSSSLEEVAGGATTAKAVETRKQVTQAYRGGSGGVKGFEKGASEGGERTASGLMTGRISDDQRPVNGLTRIKSEDEDDSDHDTRTEERSPGCRHQPLLQSPGLLLAGGRASARARSEEPPSCAERLNARRPRLKSESCPVEDGSQSTIVTNSAVDGNASMGESNKENVVAARQHNSSSGSGSTTKNILPPRAFRDSYHQSPQRKQAEATLDHIRKIKLTAGGLRFFLIF